MMTTAALELPYSLTVPELFHPEQIITQLVDGDEGRRHPLTRVVHTVGERSITLSTPSAPSLGVEEWGAFDHPLSQLRPLTDLLPPKVGVLDKLAGLPRTNRTLVNRVGMILTAQRIPSATVTTPTKLNGPVSEAWVFVNARFAHYTLDLLNAYMPWENMAVRLRMRQAPFETRRVIIIRPQSEGLR
jgi:hypothetical protein